MTNNELANLKIEAGIARNFSEDEWRAILQEAPIRLLMEETDYRFKVVRSGIGIYRGESDGINN